jgi:S-adenosylmethionine:tRNA ribosyltransferase-isomerase
MKTKISYNRLSDYDYILPAKLIAQQPASPRDSARLLVLDKASGKISHRHFFDLPKILMPGDVLVFNDSKVIPARLKGKKETGGAVEIFLLKAQSKKNSNSWQCLIGGKVKPEQIIYLNKKIQAQAIKKIDEKTWLVQFNVPDEEIFKLGETPLPPYIKTKSKLTDYQTVFAKASGSVAAPTAGLHFTKRLLNQLKKRGVQIEFVTLHVGLGTFLPVETDDILKHKMHSEWAEIDSATVKRLNRAKKSGQRIIAVGTTAARTLESFAVIPQQLKTQKRATDIFIYPGYQFKFVDSLITNFHLPKSTLLMLVSALAGKDKIDSAYQEAIKKNYKFFSFGDGMLIK